MQEQINKTTLRAILALSLSCSLALLTTACGGGGGGGGAPAPTAPTTVTRQATMTTAQEVPAPNLPDPAAATPGGTASFTLYSTNKLRGSMTLTGFNLSGTPQTTAVTAAHIHDGDIGLAPTNNVVKLLVADTSKSVWSLPANTTLTGAQVARFKAGGYYVNAHTPQAVPQSPPGNSAGLIRGQLISFADNVQAIFTANCVGCHFTGNSVAAPMSLVAGASYASLFSQGVIRVIAGDSANSILFKRITGTTAGPQMPPDGSTLSVNNQNLIKVWIDTGAANN